jgi:RNA polymerase sigma-70 factor (ECF subfamily)
MNSPEPESNQQLAGHRDAVHRYILGIVRNAAESDDLTQVVMMRAHAKIDTLDDRFKALPWLYRIATNVCYDHFRQSKSRDKTIEAAANLSRSEDDAPCLDKALEQSEMSACVQDYLEGIPDSYRAAILLHDVHGLTNPEIAAMLGISLPAVKIRLHRARQKLRDVLTGACRFTRDERGVVVCEPKRQDPGE